MTKRICLWLAVAVLALACAKTGPLEPVWGKQTCAHCKMLVSDPHYAAQLLTAENERQFFDDIGCMVERLERHAEIPRGMWVRDGQRWVEARSARYRMGAPSPMDYGFAPDAKGSADFASIQRDVVSRRERREP